MFRSTAGATLALIALASCSSSSDSSSDATPNVADIRADSNRDGVVRFDDDSDAEKMTWDAKHGAVFVANIDDDLDACKKTGDDTTLPSCNDAANDVVDGPDDLLDLARIKTRPWNDAPPADATASFDVDKADHIRLFKKSGDDFAVYAPGDPVTPDEVRAGVELAIEATDIVRDPAVWDGYVVVTFHVTSGGKTTSDSVKLRVAPVLTSHHLEPVETVYVSNTGDRQNGVLRTGLADVCVAAALSKPTEFSVQDQWTQDLFETGYMSMPAEGGKQHVIRVAYRTPALDDPSDAKNPLRAAGAVVFTKMRGKDFAGVQQFDPSHSLDMDSLNSFGNLETIPPYTKGGESFPFGRVIRGKTDKFFPDPSFTTMLEAQGQQPPVYIDTSWLYVGHVDETLSFVKASSPRGWALLANDPTLAKKMLQDASSQGHGTTAMFVGLSWYDDNGDAKPADTTIDGVLANTDVMQASAKAAVAIDGQIAKIKEATGITDEEIIRIPFLHMSTMGASIAYQPGTVNGLYVADNHFVAPDPHGPVVDGKDIFREQMTHALEPLSVTVDFIDDWDEYHAVEGEIHCGTNSLRRVPDAKWWESAR